MGDNFRYCGACGTVKSSKATSCQQCGSIATRVPSAPSPENTFQAFASTKFYDFQYGLTPIAVPNACLRCGSTMLDYEIDPSKRPEVFSWVKFKDSEASSGCGALILSIITLGLWLIVYGSYSLLMIPIRMKQKSDAIRVASMCVRTTCRECSLTFFPGEKPTA